MHPPDPCKFTQELLDHGMECFPSKGVIIHADMPLFKEASVKQMLGNQCHLIEICYDKHSWASNPVQKLWDLIEFNDRSFSVFNTIELEKRLKINWNRIMCQDDLFQNLSSFENLHLLLTEL